MARDQAEGELVALRAALGVDADPRSILLGGARPEREVRAAERLERREEQLRIVGRRDAARSPTGPGRSRRAAVRRARGSIDTGPTRRSPRPGRGRGTRAPTTRRARAARRRGRPPPRRSPARPPGRRPAPPRDRRRRPVPSGTAGSSAAWATGSGVGTRSIIASCSTRSSCGAKLSRTRRDHRHTRAVSTRNTAPDTRRIARTRSGSFSIQTNDRMSAGTMKPRL